MNFAFTRFWMLPQPRSRQTQPLAIAATNSLHFSEVPDRQRSFIFAAFSSLPPFSTLLFFCRLFVEHLGHNHVSCGGGISVPCQQVPFIADLLQTVSFLARFLSIGNVMSYTVFDRPLVMEIFLPASFCNQPRFEILSDGDRGILT